LQWKQQLWFCYVVQHKSLASLLVAIRGFGFAMLFKQTLGKKKLLIAMEALVLLCCSTQILSCIAGCNMRLWICNVVQHRSSATLLVAAIEALVLLYCSNRSSAAKVAGDQPVKLLVAVVFK
jgi:hypothetical protein